jgi:hypothetical protein
MMIRYAILCCIVAMCSCGQNNVQGNRPIQATTIVCTFTSHKEALAIEIHRDLEAASIIPYIEGSRVYTVSVDSKDVHAAKDILRSKPYALQLKFSE